MLPPTFQLQRVRTEQEESFRTIKRTTAPDLYCVFDHFYVRRSSLITFITVASACYPSSSLFKDVEADTIHLTSLNLTD